MNCRLVDLRNKEVINIKDGTRLGCVDDVEIDTCNARLVSIIVYGRLKCFGLFGRCDDIIIRWNDIQVIGEDTILVCFSCDFKQRRKNKFFKKLWG